MWCRLGVYSGIKTLDCILVSDASRQAPLEYHISLRMRNYLSYVYLSQDSSLGIHLIEYISIIYLS